MLYLKRKKDNKIILQFNTTYELADNEKLLIELFGEDNFKEIQLDLRLNAFKMCLTSTVLDYGDYIVE